MVSFGTIIFSAVIGKSADAFGDILGLTRCSANACSRAGSDCRRVQASAKGRVSRNRIPVPCCGMLAPARVGVLAEMGQTAGAADFGAVRTRRVHIRGSVDQFRWVDSQPDHPRRKYRGVRKRWHLDDRRHLLRARARLLHGAHAVPPRGDVELHGGGCGTDHGEPWLGVPFLPAGEWASLRFAKRRG